MDFLKYQVRAKCAMRQFISIISVSAGLLALTGCSPGGVDSKTRELAIRYGHVRKDADRIYEVSITSAEGADQLISRLHRLPDLVSLSTAEVKLSDDQLEHIGKLHKLTRLIIRTGDVGDEDLKHFSRLTALTELHLTANPIEGTGLVHLKQLKSLENLTLTATLFAGPGIEQLAELPNLHQLFIESTKIDDIGMTHVGQLPHLRRLDFGDTDVSEAGLFKLVDSYWLVQPNFPDNIVGDPSDPQRLMEERRNMMRRFRQARLEVLRRARNEGKHVPPDEFVPFPYIPGDERTK